MMPCLLVFYFQQVEVKLQNRQNLSMYLVQLAEEYKRELDSWS